MTCVLRYPIELYKRIIKGTNGESKELGYTCLRNSGLPKGSNSYGNGGLILCNRKRSPTIVVISMRDYSGHAAPRIITELRKLNEYSKNKDIVIRKDKRIYSKFMLNPDLFYIAYDKLKSKPGNMTPGIDETTLDGISKDLILQIIEELSDESFQFKPGRRTYIPKSNGGKRPLTIGSPRDKLVQEVMRMILEAIFEPSFQENSHGFRPNRSCHTALRHVFTKFRPCY